MPMNLFFKCKVELDSSSNKLSMLKTSGWIPEHADRIKIDISKNIEMEIYCSRESISFITAYDRVQTESLKGFEGIPLSYIDVKFKFSNIDENLGTYILDGCNSKNENLDELVFEIARNIQANIIKYVNRLIEYVRSYNGQYGLKPISFDEKKLSSNMITLRAIVSENNTNWYDFDIKHSDQLVIGFMDADNALFEYQWEKVKEYVLNNNRTELTLELIANAYYLLDSGHGRSAIIEVCSALETAVSEFSKYKDFSWLNLINSNGRVDPRNISSQINHLKFSTSVKFLFPILFSEQEVSKETINDCIRAIEVRNNVIHNGQRNVDDRMLREIIPQVEVLCKFLLTPKLPTVQ